MRGTALSEGIGEKLTRLPSMPQCQVLIAKPGISVSTKTVYEMLDARTLRPEDHPDIDGMEVLSQIRAQSEVAILVVSARGQEQEKVEALDHGADDYITKPFHINELLARVRVALRKKTSDVIKTKVFTMDTLKIDFEKYKVFVEDKEIHMTPIEYKLLVLLVENAGKVLTHSFIIRKIWGYSTTEDSQSLRVFMANIRRKIEKDSAHPRYIITEVGVGYRFVES